MEYQKVINLLDNTRNQLSRIRTKNWIEINDQSKGVYKVNSGIRFKTTVLKSSLCDYSNANILVKGRITIPETGADAAARQVDERDKGVIFKHCASFINCKTEINNTEIDDAKDINIAISIYNVIDNYSKTSGSLWQYYKNEPNNSLTDSESFKSKIEITGKTPADGNTKDIEIIVSLKYLSIFWRSLEMPLIICEVNLILTWSSTCFITNSTGTGRFEITDTKLYVPFVTL